VSIELHLSVAHINDITRQIAICNDTYKFTTYQYSLLQSFQLTMRWLLLLL